MSTQAEQTATPNAPLNDDQRREQMSHEADSYIHWAAGRAAAIAVTPIPIADMFPLIANEIYMGKQIGTAYGVELTESVLRGMLGAMGASFAGMAAASFMPGLKIPIAAGITYAAGKTIKRWCESGGALPLDELRSEFRRAKEEGRDKKWEL